MQLQVLRPATFLKGSQQSVSCEYCEIFKNSFLYRTPPVSASEYYPGKMKLKTHFYFEKRKILYCTEVRFYSFFLWYRNVTSELLYYALLARRHYFVQ